MAGGNNQNQKGEFNHFSERGFAGKETFSVADRFSFAKDNKAIAQKAVEAKEIQTVSHAPRKAGASVSLGIIATLVTGGVVTGVVATEKAYSVEVNLFSSDASSLVFEIQTHNLDPEGPPPFAVLSYQGEVYDTQLLGDRLFYAFFDLSENTAYELTIKRDEAVDYRASFLTGTYDDMPQGHAFVEVMEFSEGNLYFSVFNHREQGDRREESFGYPYVTVNVRESNGKAVYQADQTEEYKDYEFSGLDATKDHVITLSYKGRGLGYAEVVGEREEPEHSHWSQESSEPIWSQDSSEPIWSQDSSESESSATISGESPVGYSIDWVDTIVDYDFVELVFELGDPETSADYMVTLDYREAELVRNDSTGLYHCIFEGLPPHSEFLFDVIYLPEDEFVLSGAASTIDPVTLTVSENAVLAYASDKAGKQMEEHPGSYLTMGDGLNANLVSAEFDGNGMANFVYSFIYDDDYGFTLYLASDDGFVSIDLEPVRLGNEERPILEVGSEGTIVNIDIPSGYIDSAATYQYRLVDTGAYDLTVSAFGGALHSINLVDGGINGETGEGSYELTPDAVYTLTLYRDGIVVASPCYFILES